MGKQIDKVMKKTFPHQPVPEKMQTRMFLREKAVTIGRRAEEILRGRAFAPKAGDNLMAQAMIGRLALMTDLPEGSTPEKLWSALQQRDAFKLYRSRSVDDQLRGLSGSFLKDMAPQKRAERHTECMAPQKKTERRTERTVPQKAIPSIEKGMSL